MATATKGKKAWQSQAQAQLQQWLRDGTAVKTDLSMDPKVLRPDPERLQSRVETDPEHIRMLAEVLERVEDLNPVVVFRDPETGKYMLADGFHRHGAYKKHRRDCIPAYVVRGTIDDAIQYSASANLEFSKPPSIEDKKKACRMLLATPDGFYWSTGLLARNCGLSRSTVTAVRQQYCSQLGVPLPAEVKFSRPDADPYEPIETKDSRTGRPRFVKGIGGKVVYLSNDREIAREKLKAIMDERRGLYMRSVASSRERCSAPPVPSAAKGLATLGGSSFSERLRRRGVECVAVSALAPIPQCRAIAIAREAVCIPISACTADELFRAVGLAAILRKIGHFSFASRWIVCCDEMAIDGYPAWIAAKAADGPDPIEFMTPEELVAEFGPKAGGAESA